MLRSTPTELVSGILKGQSHENLLHRFFSPNSSTWPRRVVLRPFRILMAFHGDIRILNRLRGVGIGHQGVNQNYVSYENFSSLKFMYLESYYQ